MKQSLGPGWRRALDERRWFIPLLVLVLTAGCARPDSLPAQAGNAFDGSQPTMRKRITAGVIADFATVIGKLENLAPGSDAVEVMIGAGLTTPNDQGALTPVLAEAVPSVENGHWRVLPDGRMETTWKLKPGLQWHDGTAFSAADVAFTGRLARDPELPVLRHPGTPLVESIEAVDPHTVTVRWKQLYIAADGLFAPSPGISLVTIPLPRHILEPVYNQDSRSVLQHGYWSDEFVGMGPYRLREWVPGSFIVLEAYDRYALGRPRIDEVEIRFIPDADALVTSLLAGVVQVTLGRNLSLDQVLEAERRWPAGRMERAGLQSWFGIAPQFIDPAPSIIGNLTFRRALMHALDRQEMADTIMYGLVPVAHVFMNPAHADYPTVEPRISKYEYDFRRTADILRGLGYTVGADGIYRGADGATLEIELRTMTGDVVGKAGEVVADQWRKTGVRVQTTVVTAQRTRDREWRALRPGFETMRRGTGLENLSSYHSREIQLPETRFLGANIPRYGNPEFDGLLDQYFATIPKAERAEVLGQIMRHMSEQLNIMTLFYDTEPALISRKLVNVTARPVGSTQGWNVHLWDVAGS
jgi:peptide/nickel transport system substrate-binding protein